VAADVSSRHISFLETGRSRPSRQMVLQLGSALGLALRDQNALLVAADFEEAYATPSVDEALAGPIGDAVTRMMAQHEPYPMVLMDRLYTVLRANTPAMRMVTDFLAEPEALVWPFNTFDVLFDPRLARPFVVGWPVFARALLSRMQQEALRRPNDAALAAMVERMFTYPDVPADFRTPDFSQDSPAVFTLSLKRDQLEVSFLTMATQFSAPQSVMLEELIIESYFPVDDTSDAYCRAGAPAS